MPKKLLLENGAPIAADKRLINDGVEELIWLAALKPTTIGVPTFRDDLREYLEIAVLRLRLRPGANASRLTELIHRSIPYPVLLIQSDVDSVLLSLAHLRWSQGQSGQTVLDGSVITARLDGKTPSIDSFLVWFNVTKQPRQNLYALYQGWIERFEALAAARVTGSYVLALDADAAARRRAALAEHEHLAREIASLRARANKESQLSRRVELNMQLKLLESRIIEATTHI